MKIATTTGDFKAFCKNDEEIIRELHRAGFRYIDFSMYSFTPDCVYMQDGWRDEVKKIKDVAVIGLPDKRLGEIAAAIIEIKEGMDCTEEEICEFCMSLPKYKRPRRIIFAKVPRNPTGKIEKPKLREKYCGGSLVEAQITG